MTTTRFHGHGTHAIEIAFTLLASAGGIAKYLHETMKNNKPFKIIELLCKAFISAFVGWVAAHCSIWAGATGDAVFVSASIAGWLGADSMEMLVPLLKRFFQRPPTT